MKWVKVAAASLNQTPLDWQGNLENIVGALGEARTGGASILCLPELAITGYGCEDAFLSPSVLHTASEVLLELLPHTRGMIVCLGLPMLWNKAVYNVCAVVKDTEVLGLVPKRALAGDGIHYEPRWFKAWPRGQRASIRLAGSDLLLGDLVFDIGGVRLGLEICEDAWVAERPGAELAAEGVDIILNPSASHFAFGKKEIRRRLALEGSRVFGAAYVYSNLLGNEAGRAIYDGDSLIAARGRLLAEGPRFSYRERQLIFGDYDVELGRTQHARLSSFTPRVAPGVVESAFAYPDLGVPPSGGASALASQPSPHDAVRGWEASSALKEEEFSRAVALGLFDYLRKSRSFGFVISLSGGADSAAVALLCRFMLGFSVGELGLAGVQARLHHLPELERARSVEELAARLITTVYQATENSGQVTRHAAQAVATAAGSRHIEVDVSEPVKQYVSIVEERLGRRLTWAEDDLALQNVQARARAPVVWLLANVQGALLLATSNRSEAAVGYATMDGDTAGGLSPIAGIDKVFLRRWLAWLEAEGIFGGKPVKELGLVNAQAPTAELRPPEQEQTDERDLMPYDVLDAIERAAVRDKLSPLDCFLTLRASMPEVEGGQLYRWVERFFRMFSRNQWKRERFAPSFHLDDESLDPKTWCRFPILSGGFERELAQLRAYVEREGR